LPLEDYRVSFSKYKQRIQHYPKIGKKQRTCKYDEEDIAIALASLSFQISLQDLYNKYEVGNLSGDRTDVEEIG
jgi:hypothetical protein